MIFDPVLDNVTLAQYLAEAASAARSYGHEKGEAMLMRIAAKVAKDITPSDLRLAQVLDTEEGERPLSPIGTACANRILARYAAIDQLARMTHPRGMSYTGEEGEEDFDAARSEYEQGLRDHLARDAEDGVGDGDGTDEMQFLSRLKGSGLNVAPAIRSRATAAVAAIVAAAKTTIPKKWVSDTGGFFAPTMTLDEALAATRQDRWNGFPIN